MRVLGLDTATPVAGLAVLEDGRLLGELFLNTGRTHSEKLLPALHQLLDYCELKLRDIDGFAVAIGPGSFTGLRIGLATAKGFAHSLGKPLVGVPTLDALALNAAGAGGIICPILNARKNEVYAALYVSHNGQELNRLSQYMAVSPAELVDLLEQYEEPVTLLGDGVAVLGTELREKLGNRARWMVNTLSLPRASQIAYLGLVRLQQKSAEDIKELVPFYIRPSEAEARLMAKERGVEK
ncbi:tRNA (adenosine(37)-N6)-threonylcarbamoyltransferase complex dimerization subunit type 1 TsaB [Calderihabitans maritimus]|uniref:Peptidase M22, glycoprotease n=1 Tax=Calderihabitans maritimus TaxID=1246530 RepID=A0A1Z5HT58_9FIRM|nr:tRNA (adenosine(37)-N6)-threonylcarbamoyltransferase complex dimerization subunit type 1 TsaB [Calderihabitans maritimus]GAW92511.1 peptidase M22, glycoprotease [Calderihabitans maritimus]